MAPNIGGLYPFPYGAHPYGAVEPVYTTPKLSALGSALPAIPALKGLNKKYISVPQSDWAE